MRVPSHPTLVRRMLDRRLKQLVPSGPILAASLMQVNKRCGQPSCACHHGGPLHQAHHVAFRDGGKTRTVYVPQDLLKEVRKWVQESQRLKTLIREVSQLSVALIKGHVLAPPRGAGTTLTSAPSWFRPFATSSPISTLLDLTKSTTHGSP